MFVPQIFVGMLVIQEFRKVTLSDAWAEAERGVTRLQNQAAQVLEVGRRISDLLTIDKDVETLLTTRYPSTLAVFAAYHGFSTFRHYTDISSDVTGIHAYVSNPTILDNWEIRPLTDDVRASNWFQTARRYPSFSGWFSLLDTSSNPQANVSLIRYFRYHGGDEVLLVVDLNTSHMDSLLGQEGYETLVLDPNLSVVASSHPELVGSPLTDPRLVALTSQGEPGTFDREYEGQRSRVFLRDLTPSTTFNGLKIVCIVSPDVILRPGDRISATGLLILGAGALVSLLFLWVVYTLFARRLERLSNKLPLVAAGDFDQVPSVDGTDEIGQLASRFGSMVYDIRRLMTEVHDSNEATRALERAQGEIRLRMLASQINPHFLFNVLESIRMKAHLNGEKEIASTVKLLGRIMRRNLEASGKPIPLKEELENVRCYLEIEKFRLEEKLDYQFDLGPGVEAILVPPLIVEPLVENAVVHGLERSYGGGKVTVRAWLETGTLAVEVADNGLGMSEERRQGLMDQPNGHHVGLVNIDQRLRLTYGEAFGLTVESTEGRGTTVSFRIPGGSLVQSNDR
jgi:two-component system sensor histidine kinase YesM